MVGEIAAAMGVFSRIAFLDDIQTGGEILDICENFYPYAEEFSDLFPAFGDGALRMGWITRLEDCGIVIPTLVHPTAVVSRTAGIFPATVVAAQAVIQPEVVVEKGCIIGAGAVVDHNSLIGYGCHIDSGAVVSARCMVPALQKVSAGGVWTRAESEAYAQSMAGMQKNGG